MQIDDEVYGPEEIIDPLVLEIINSTSFQRLKDINQAGYSKPHLGVDHFSRFDHCVGVYLLLRKYQASFEEQVAGLIHDVSHSVFSHSIDYILAAGSEKTHDHQDNIHENYVLESDLMPIFKRHKIDVYYLLDDKNFPLKETKLPELCADRIDYSFREALVYKVATKKEVKTFLTNIVAMDNKWIFTDFELAKKYAELFVKLSSTKWAGFASAVMFRTTGDYIKYGLEKGHITQKDLYTTDKEILNKLDPFVNQDKELKKLSLRFNNKVEVVNNPKDFDVKVYCKSRVVDPLCFYQDQILKISEIDKSWLKTIKEESQPKEYFLKFMD